MPIKSSASGVPAGTVAYFAANAVPAGWLKANGATVSRTAYAALFLAIGTTYGAGDGSTTFKLPDCRGEFLRGLDDGRGVDTGRVIGSAQASQNLSHNHGGSTGGHEMAFSGTYNGSVMQQAMKEAVYNAANHTHSISSDGGTESRPRNVAMLACIKY